MSAQTELTKTEARLYLREPLAVFWVLFFPVILLVILGSIPAFREPNDALEGRTTIAVYVPIIISLTLAFSISVVPTALATYRERGYLRRLATTPVGPRRVLIAQLLVNAVAAAAASTVVLLVGWLLFDVDMPRHPWGFIVAFVLATASLLGLGLLLAAIAPSSRVASTAGTLLFFPLMFFAGLYVPLDVMPDGLQRIGELTPLGAAVQSMQLASDGSWPAWSLLAVLLAWAVASNLLALRLFTWE